MRTVSSVLALAILALVPRWAAAQAPDPSTPTADTEPVGPTSPSSSTLPTSTSPPPTTSPLAVPADLPPPGFAIEPLAIAGYDHGHYIATRDDAFHLGVSGWLQARWQMDHAESENFDHRFSVPVGRLVLAGHAFRTTDFRLAGDGGSGTFQLLDAYIDQPLPFATLRFGQFKPFFSQQQLAHVVHLEFTERPITYGFAGISRDLGVSLHHAPSFDSGGLEWAVGAFDGTGITPVAECPIDSMAMTATCGLASNVPDDARPLVVARLAYQSARIDAYREGDLDHDRPRFSIGAGYAVDLASARARAMQHDATLDLVIKAEGWSLTTAGFLKSSRTATERRTDFGWHAQIGRVVVPRLFGLAARFAELRVPSTKLYEITGAIDIYRRGHALKWQFEGGALHDTSTAATTWIARAQTQLLF